MGIIDRFTHWDCEGGTPYSKFNLFLAGFLDVCLLLDFLAITEGGYTVQSFFDEGGVALVTLFGVPIAFLLILFNNRKIKSIPAFIIHTVVLLIVGGILAVIVFLLFGWMLALGGGSSTSSSNSNNTPVNHNGFTDDQERTASYAGFNNAYEAQQAGAKWDNNSQSWLK